MSEFGSFDEDLTLEDINGWRRTGADYQAEGDLPDWSDHKGNEVRLKRPKNPRLHHPIRLSPGRRTQASRFGSTGT